MNHVDIAEDYYRQRKQQVKGLELGEGKACVKDQESLRGSKKG